MGIIIFDLEGVLVDNSKRFRYALMKAKPGAKDEKELSRGEKKIFWETFFDEKLAEEMDEVNEFALKLLDKYVREGKKVIILSGTKKRVVKTLLKKIKDFAKEKGLKFSPALIIWRGEKDYRKAPIFKLAKIREIEKLFMDEVEEVHDDDKDTIELLRREGIRAIYWENGRPKNF